jgi:hypothetical protein
MPSNGRGKSARERRQTARRPLDLAGGKVAIAQQAVCLQAMVKRQKIDPVHDRCQQVQRAFRPTGDAVATG